MKNKGLQNDLKKLLVQRLAFIMAVFYMLSPFQQQLSTVLHSLTHNLSLPDYVITHSGEHSGEGVDVHQYGEDSTDKIVHEHQILDLVQRLLESTNDGRQDTDPKIPKKSFDKYLAGFSYSLEKIFSLEEMTTLLAPYQPINNGHPNLWLEPPISILLQEKERPDQN